MILRKPSCQRHDVDMLRFALAPTGNESRGRRLRGNRRRAVYRVGVTSCELPGFGAMASGWRKPPCLRGFLKGKVKRPRTSAEVQSCSKRQKVPFSLGNPGGTSCFILTLTMTCTPP